MIPPAAPLVVQKHALSRSHNKIVFGAKPAIAALALCLACASSATAGQANRSGGSSRPRVAQPRKLDRELTSRVALGAGWRHTRLIVQLNGASLPTELKPYQRAHLDLIDAYVLEMPDRALNLVAQQPSVRSAHFDRPIWASDYLSTHTTAADAVWDSLGYTGKGVGVAVIDSGISSWHDDLTPQLTKARRYPYGDQRVAAFVDFVNGQAQPYDDHGHGSHVAGIILGNGYDSRGRQSGMAPDADLVALKVLDHDGKGSISNILAALDWVARNAAQYHIKVVNLSAGAGVTESYWTDPLTLGAKRLVDQGIVVVAAAGNLGKNADGQEQYGGILCPGNAPWVLTIGASSTEGTIRRHDDKLASFSSRGPTRGDYLAKPDLIAPGYGILSFAVPGSSLYNANRQYLVDGSLNTEYPPYLSLSGTSMAAPQATGAIALMFEANPRLTPNLVKAILQYTAQSDDAYNPLEEGAGFLDALSAVRLAKFYQRNTPGTRMPVQPSWSQQIIWGNHRLTGGYVNPLGNAWSTKVVWGAPSVDVANGGDNIVWGTGCSECDNIVWGTADANGDNIVWGTNGGDNIVWGTNGGDNIVWGTGCSECDNIVWGTSVGTDDNIVWGTDCGGNDCDRIVWGTNGGDNIVWGTADTGDNIVWGTNGGDNIVWGTNGGDNIVWGTNGGDNIVWGTNGGDNIVWGTAGGDNIVWGTAADDSLVWEASDVDAALSEPRGRSKGGARGER
jgi:serine protease AprX